MDNDKLIIGGHEFNSRFILGSGKYSMKLIEAAVKDAGAEIITLAVRRANTKEQESILVNRLFFPFLCACSVLNRRLFTVHSF